MLLQCVVKIHIRKRYNQQQSVIRIQLFVAIHRVADGAYTQFVCLHIAYTQLVDKKKTPKNLPTDLRAATHQKLKCLGFN